MKIFNPADDKTIFALMGTAYALNGVKAIVSALGPILTAAQILVAIVTVVWIWRRAQGQRLANRQLQNRLKPRRRHDEKY